jgi:uncharacterized membrane protein
MNTIYHTELRYQHLPKGQNQLEKCFGRLPKGQNQLEKCFGRLPKGQNQLEKCFGQTARRSLHEKWRKINFGDYYFFKFLTI